LYSVRSGAELGELIFSCGHDYELLEDTAITVSRNSARLVEYSAINCAVIWSLLNHESYLTGYSMLVTKVPAYPFWHSGDSGKKFIGGEAAFGFSFP
jgi:hypothetical protein